METSLEWNPVSTIPAHPTMTRNKTIYQSVIAIVGAIGGSAGRCTTGPALIANWQRIEELLNSELDLCAVTRLPAGMEPADPAHEVSIPFQSHDANMNIEAPGFMKSSDS
jgi:hypothetical protein